MKVLNFNRLNTSDQPQTVQTVQAVLDKAPERQATQTAASLLYFLYYVLGYQLGFYFYH